jgi:hypothetical protein
MKLTLWVPITLVIKHLCSNDDHKKFIGGFANQDQVASKFLNNDFSGSLLRRFWESIHQSSKSKTYIHSEATKN